ncbi:hypothetical protein MTP99_017774 [Tenebrio molitor]|nr:hypothetical protein MTP99_017774 [Tenebrio molitor]
MRKRMIKLYLTRVLHANEGRLASYPPQGWSLPPASPPGAATPNNTSSKTPSHTHTHTHKTRKNRSDDVDGTQNDFNGGMAKTNNAICSP